MKNYYFQMLRGIAIIAVIMIHCTNPLLKDNSNYILQIVYRQFINFAVAMFVFLSGYFTKKDDVLTNPKSFIKRRFIRLIPPYLFWSAIGIIMSQTYSFPSIIKRLIFGTSFVQLYYIIVLLQLTIITPILLKTIDKKLIRIIIFAISPITLIAQYISVFTRDATINRFGTLFTTWLIFYYFGLVVRNLDISLDTFTSKLRLFLVAYVVMISVSIFESISIYNHFNVLDFAASQIKLSTFVVSLLVIAIALAFSSIVKVTEKNILVIIGNYSYGLYLAHYAVMLVINKIGFLYFITNQLLYCVVTSFIVLSLTLLFCILCRKILSNKSNIIGL